MKILYVVDPQQDYLASMIFEGLCSLVGEKNVCVYPMLKRWKYGGPDNDYILPGGKPGWTSKVDYEAIYPDLLELNMDEICNSINDFDYIILASPREYVVKSFREIKKRCPIIQSKIAMLDGEDGGNIHTHLIDEFTPDFLFKREVFYDMQYAGKKIYPLPFAAFQKMIPIDNNEKTLNIFGVFGNTNHLRVDIVKRFHVLNIDNSIVDIDTGVDNWDRNKPRHGKMSYIEYMKKISSSKIGLGCIGHGVDTVRFWEIPSYKTMMMCIPPKISIPFPFKDRETAVFLKEDLSDFKELLEYYLSHDKEREDIANAGYNHLMKFHTCEKRVLYMLTIMESSL